MSTRYIDRILNSEPFIPEDYDPAEDLFVHPGSPYKRQTPIPKAEMAAIERGIRERKCARLRLWRAEKKKAQSPTD
jgi:hypothetical protein